MFLVGCGFEGPGLQAWVKMFTAKIVLPQYQTTAEAVGFIHMAGRGQSALDLDALPA